MSRTAATIWFVFGLVLLGAIAEQGEGKGGISGSGSVRGAVQRFASIVVNDIELDTSQTHVLANGAPSTVSALRVGYQVEVEAADLQAGQADSITYFSSVRGPIESIDTVAGTLRLVGQNVTISAVTNLDGVLLPALTAGTWVDISGMRTAANALVATYLRRVAPDSPVRLTGVLQRISTTGSLRVAGFPVAASAALRAGLQVGDTVSAKGTLNAGRGALLATRIFRLDAVAPETLNVSLEGALRRVKPSRLYIGLESFGVTAATEFVNTTPARLVPGDRIHVDAVRTDAGLLAETVVFRPTEDARAEGVLEAIEPLTSDSARIVVSGLELLVNQGSDFGRSSDPDRNLTGLQDLVPGHYLKVRAYVDGREAAAHRIERESYESRSRIRTLVTAKSPVGFELLGSKIALGPNTVYEVAGQSVTQTEFLAALEVGDFVDVDYDNDWTPGMTPDKVAIEETQ